MCPLGGRPSRCRNIPPGSAQLLLKASPKKYEPCPGSLKGEVLNSRVQESFPLSWAQAPLTHAHLRHICPAD